MGKIISIRNSFIAVRKDDGKIEMVSRSDCDFEPIVGEKVEIIFDGSKTVLRRKNPAMVPSEPMEEKNQEKSDDFKKTNNFEPNPVFQKTSATPRGKIIEIQEDIVTIGKPDKSIQEVRLEDCNFQPNIGDEVEIFSGNNKIMVVKSAKNQTSSTAQPINNITISIADIQKPKPKKPKYEYKEEKIKVNKIKYCILTVLFGWCGAQRFYEKEEKIGYFLAFLGFIVLLGFLTQLSVRRFQTLTWSVWSLLLQEMWVSIPGAFAIFDFFKVLKKESDEEGNVTLIKRKRISK